MDVIFRFFKFLFPELFTFLPIIKSPKNNISHCRFGIKFDLNPCYNVMLSLCNINFIDIHLMEMGKGKREKLGRVGSGRALMG